MSRLAAKFAALKKEGRAAFVPFITAGDPDMETSFAILDKLPAETTRVIIAHRLNTIDNVDQIFFVNSGGVTLAGSMEHAVDMLLHEKRAS